MQSKTQRKDESRPKSVTLEDVAKMAGVTSMTVSRVVKGKGYVSPKTREKVLRVAEEMKYTANLAARALATGRTGIVAVISDRLNKPYYANIVHHLGIQLEASGYRMRLLYTDEEINDLIDSTSASAVDGIIVAGLHHRTADYFSMTSPRPCIFINTTPHQKMDHIQGELVPALKQAIQIMIDSGRKRIAYVGKGEPHRPNSALDEEIRSSTYRAAMEGAGRIPELFGIIPYINDESPKRVEDLKNYLKTNGCPDGLVCFNDEIALHVYRALMELKIRIPEDVLLVGCDDLPFMRFLEPPVSSIALPFEEICAQAWTFLQARMADPDLPLQEAVFNAQLMVRKSLEG